MFLNLPKIALNYAIGRMTEATSWLALIGSIEANLHIRINSDVVNDVAHAGVYLAAALAIVLREGWQAKNSPTK